MELATTFLFLGGVLLIGFFADLFFAKTRIPDSLILIAMGFLIGPVLNLINQEIFIGLAPFFSILALIIIIFENGFNLNLKQVVENFGLSLNFSLIGFVFSAVLISLALIFLFKMQVISGIYLGAIISGTTTLTVYHLVKNLRIEQKLKNMLWSESMINSLLIITIAVVILQVFRQGTFTFNIALSGLIYSIAVAFFFGVVFSVVWFYLFNRFLRANRLNYVFTLACVFVLFSLSEVFQGNGIFAVLFFSVVLANLTKIFRKLKFKVPGYKERETAESIDFIRDIHEAITFFIRVFFFVFLGMVFSLKSLNQTTILISLTILVLLFGTRFLAAIITNKIYRGAFSRYISYIALTFPKGLEAIVLAVLPLQYGLDIPFIKEIILIVIFVTTIISIAGTFYGARRFGVLDTETKRQVKKKEEIPKRSKKTKKEIKTREIPESKE